MASTFALTGTYQAIPPLNMPSGDPLITAPIDERQTLENELASILFVEAGGGFKSVTLGDMTNTSVIVIKPVGGPIIVRMSYVDAADIPVQVDIPVDQFFALTTTTRRITALQIKADPAATFNVSVKFFLGQKAG